MKVASDTLVLLLGLSLATPLVAQRLLPDSLRTPAPSFSLTLWDPWRVPAVPCPADDSLRDPAPAFTLPRWTPRSPPGPVLGLRDLAGQVVVLDFWSRYCRPCIPQHEALVELAPAWQAQGVRFLSILTWDEPSGLEAFLAAHGGPPPFPILLDSAGTLLKAYDSYGVPTAVILDHHGKVAWRHLGGVSARADLPRLLPPLIAARDGGPLPRNPNRLTD